MASREENIRVVKASLPSYPDFPKPGILFYDIFGILRDPIAAAALNDVIVGDCTPFKGKFTAVCGLDSRGFLFGPQIALQLNIPFVPIRKKGKLPGDIISQQFQLEYGFDQLEIQRNSMCGGNVLLVDDLLATGGTLKAAGKLVEELGCKVGLCLVIMEIAALNGRKNIPYDVHSILPC